MRELRNFESKGPVIRLFRRERFTYTLEEGRLRLSVKNFMRKGNRMYYDSEVQKKTGEVGV